MLKWNGVYSDSVLASMHCSLDYCCCSMSHLFTWHTLHTSSMNISWILGKELQCETQCIFQMTHDWCVWRPGFIMYLQHSSTTRKLVFPPIALTKGNEGKQMGILNVSDLLLKQWINVLSCLFSTVFPQRQSTEIKTTSKLLYLLQNRKAYFKKTF